MSVIDQTMPTRSNRLKDRASEILAFANTWRVAMLNALLLAATVILLMNGSRAVLTAFITMLWGAVACFVTRRVGTKYTGMQVVMYYACGTVGLICLLMAIYRMTGM